RWPIRFHCTYEESAHRLLSLVEEVGRDKGLHELNWIFDHGETLSERTMEWVAQLGGGISYQNRIAFQATAYRNRYGEAALRDVMPVRKMMASGVPLAAGTDATRVSSYNPWLAIHWAVSGKGRGGDVIWAEANRLSRTEALHHWTAAGAWFSREQGLKGQLKAGQLADIAVLDRDYFAVAEEDIADITADLTLTGGKIVHAKDRFAAHAPAPLPQLPDWSPIPIFGAPGAPSKIFLEPEPVNWKPNAVLLALATALTVPAIGPAVAQDVTRYEGWIEAKETAVVSTQLDGVVAEILFVGGERVEPGEPLILLDPFGAEIALAAARAQRDAAKAQLTGAEQEANRAAQLTTRGVASAARRDATETDRAAAAAQVAAAEAVLRRAERDMERTVIRAPIAGHISRPTVAVGAFVEAESGSPLAAIVALDPVLVAYAVPYAARLDTLRQAGANTVSELHDKITLTIELPGGSTYAQTTRPSFASAQVDPTTGAVTVWAEVANPDTLLRPGMAVTVRSALGETPR
ncbi:MAG: efflux RND transporter periplasmic adaptor subunit, partial [Pseudomonadota bacterium]